MKLSSTRRIRPTLKMHRSFPSFVLLAAALLLATATSLRAQDANDGLLRRGPHGQRPPQPQQSTPQPSALPPTQPTTLPAPAPAQQPTPSPAATSDGPAVLNAPAPHRAFVVFANGQLEVRADNSSLLQILHDIHRLTGMAITGGVAEQHIFGDYGPASPSTVLATLLDGTGANMLLRQDPVTGAPIELELTQRAGGAPPQSPLGPGFDDSPFPTQAGLPSQPIQPPPPSQPQPVQPQPAPSVNTVNATPASTNTPPASPAKTGPSTPESIYQQLLQMQQARAKAAGTTPAATTPTPPPTANPPQ